MRTTLVILALLFVSFNISGQDLEDLLDEQGLSNESSVTEAIFKSPRLISGHTVKSPAKGDLVFLISHRFGEINQGIKEFFGLDISTIRLGFEYGINDKAAAGIGRSSFNKVIDYYLKYKILQQQTGEKNIPVSLSLILSSSLKTREWTNPDLEYKFIHRISYNPQLLIARKVNSKFSVQASPGLIHRNLVRYTKDPNDLYYCGLGMRYKVSNRISVNGEYFHPFSSRIRETNLIPLSIGVDIETGGHVFQLMLSNSRGMTETVLLIDENNSWADGGIHFGFNITRTF